MIFFLSEVIQLNKLDQNICNSGGLYIFKETLLKFIRPTGSTVVNWKNPKGVKLLTRLRSGLSHLSEHKFKHSFQDSLNLKWSCGKDIDALAHFLLYRINYPNERSSFLNVIGSINRSILTKCYLRKPFFTAIVIQTIYLTLFSWMPQ